MARTMRSWVPGFGSRKSCSWSARLPCGSWCSSRRGAPAASSDWGAGSYRGRGSGCKNESRCWTVEMVISLSAWPGAGISWSAGAATHTGRVTGWTVLHGGFLASRKPEVSHSDTVPAARTRRLKTAAPELVRTNRNWCRPPPVGAQEPCWRRLWPCLRPAWFERHRINIHHNSRQ